MYVHTMCSILLSLRNFFSHKQQLFHRGQKDHQDGAFLERQDSLEQNWCSFNGFKDISPFDSNCAQKSRGILKCNIHIKAVL